MTKAYKGVSEQPVKEAKHARYEWGENRSSSVLRAGRGLPISKIKIIKSEARVVCKPYDKGVENNEKMVDALIQNHLEKTL